MQIRKDLDSTVDQRCHKELDETVLRAGPIDLLPVVQHADWEAQPLLLVALLKKLIEHAPRPLLADRKGLQRVRHVREVQEELQPLQRVLLHHLFQVLRHEVSCPSLSVTKVRRHFVDLADLANHLEVVDVVGVQNRCDADPPGLLLCFLVHLLKDICLLFCRYLEELRAVHVLQRRLVIVAQRQVITQLHEEGVGPTLVPDVVAQRSHQQRIYIYTVQPCLGRRQAKKPVDRMEHIAGMRIVVIRQIIVARFHHLMEALEGQCL
mmetsp:Transcript_69408/g.165380  ORF Transcript_69408/g.165380 Transcript_69408/m.165380 type:complete len:265 (+) Transcript_69408:269-1063(+)